MNACDPLEGAPPGASGPAPGGTAPATGPSVDATSDEAPDPIEVAFVVSPGANVMDVAGPWEVFQDTVVDRDEAEDRRHLFRLYTVSDGAGPVEASGGLTLIPDFTLSDAPAPRIISVGAQEGSPEIHRWLRAQSGRAEVTMSVCTGAFHLGRAGLLEGRRATTHHGFRGSFAREFPETTLVRDRRFVDEGEIVTAAGLTSGIDAALHVVARLLGETVAERTADYMEHGSAAWRTGRPSSPTSSAGAGSTR